MKVYNQAPLPFMGQKRKFLKQFKEQLRSYPSRATYIDLFGGSGLLSRAVKDTHPDATVIYNDYDNYHQRLAAIPQTNKLLADIRRMTRECEKDKSIPGPIKERILARIKKEVGFVDYITLSSSLLFSMKYVTSYEGLTKETFYNVVKQHDYDATGYLDGLEIVREDYKVLFSRYKYEPGVVVLIDPPYLSTEAGTYTGYWKLRDYLDVLDTLESPCWFYFTSNKSNILELCQWVSDKTGGRNPFSGAEMATTSVTLNYTASYTDMMLYKYVKKK